VKLLADENVRGSILRGLLRRGPGLDLVRVPDVGLSEADDPTVLGGPPARVALSSPTMRQH